MSLNIALKTAASGLMAAQAGLRTVSDNIANVNTPGYVRKTVNQQQLVVGGQGMGVEITGVQRVTDQYLQSASITASSDSSRWATVSQYLDNAQSQFGDPSSPNFYFTRLDSVWSSFSAAANDPSSSLQRGQAISSVQDFLSETTRINGQINQLGSTVDAQANSDVNQINDLLSQINKLNSDISRAKVSSADASGSENIQSGLVDQLATLMNIQVSGRPSGGVVIRSAEGYQLAGDQAATLSYNRTDATKGYIAIEPTGGIGQQQPITITSGDLRGLMDLRDTTLPAISNQIGEFATRMAQNINAASNASTSVPAPATLNGRNTGLDLPTAMNNFTGSTTLAIVDSSGVVQKSVAIDFAAGTMSTDGGPASAFTAGSFLSDLNTAMQGAGSATFSNGALSISAAAGGVAIDPGSSAKAGQSFSQFFGLNDIIRSTGFTNYQTGLTASDPNGFTPGDTISLRVAQGDGKPIRDVTIAIPGGGTMQDMLDALNNNTTGVGLYGSYGLDAAGTLSFTPTSGLDVSIAVTKDQSQRGAGGPSVSQLFGLGVVERSTRANRLSVDSALVGDPSLLQLSKLDLTVAAGQPAIRAGDGGGALAISQAGDMATRFDSAGTLGPVNMTLTRYASEFGGSVGRQAAAADTQKKSAASVATEATTRRQSVEGVNLDEELVRLTTYQQAFNASARMIQASKDLFDVLTQMI